MSDCMTFPDTVEEFMEQYKVVDTKQIYTNGIEFVPIYRMRQWFEHKPEIITCRECKFASGDSRICMKFNYSPIGELDFCAWAERITDGV